MKKSTGDFRPRKEYLTRNEVVDLLRETTGMKPHARLVLLAHLEHLQYRRDGDRHIEQQYVCFPSQETVARFAGVNKSTVSQYARHLTEAGWLITHDIADVPVHDSTGRQVGQRTITLRAFGRGVVSDGLATKARGRAQNLKHQPSIHDSSDTHPSNGGRIAPERQLESPATVTERTVDGDAVANNQENNHRNTH